MTGIAGTQAVSQTRRGFCAQTGAGLLGCLVAVPQLSPATRLRQREVNDIRDVIVRATERGELPGVVTLVQDFGTRPQIEVVGWRDVDRREPMRADTIFDLRSITKATTALAALLLVAGGKLSLDEPIERFLPEFRSISQPVPGDQSAVPSQPITLRHLLTHTSGLSPSRPASLGQLTEKRDLPLDEVVSRIVKEAIPSPVGTKWAYSSPGYAVIGRIVEVISGESFDKFVSRRILAPLGMRNTTFNPLGRAQRRTAALYEWKDGRIVPWPRTWPIGSWSYTAPDFGLYSTAADVASLLGSMLPGSRCLLTEALRTSMLTGTVATDVQGLKQGLGWMLTDSDQLCENMGLRSGCFGHNGAFGSMAWASIIERRIVVFLTQCLYTSSPAGVSVLRAALCRSLSVSPKLDG